MEIDKNAFLKGVTEKYPEELLEGRITVEGNVCASIFKDPLLLDENKLEPSDFLTKDGRFYFGLAKSLRKSGLVVFDEVGILSNSSENVIERFEDLGGFDTIENMTGIISLQNWDTFSDTLNRENIILKLYNNGFNLLKEVEYKDKKVIPIKLFRKMTSEQVLDWYDAFLSSYSTGYSSIVLEDEMIDIDDDFTYYCRDNNCSYESSYATEAYTKDEYGTKSDGIVAAAVSYYAFADSNYEITNYFSDTNQVLVSTNAFV